MDDVKKEKLNIFFKNKKGEGLRPLISSIGVIALALIMIIFFINSFLTETNPSSDILDSSNGLGRASIRINNTLRSFDTIAQQSKDSLSNSNAEETGYTFLLFKGAFYVPWAFLKFGYGGIIVIGDILFLSGLQIALISSFIVASMLLALVFLIIKTIRTGESER